jgi:hypothetical protein
MFNFCGPMLQFRYRNMLQAMVFLSLLVASCLAVLHAEDSKSRPKALLDQIWPYQMAHRQPLSKQDQEYAQTALILWVESYLKDEYKIVDERFFWSDRKDSMWGPISKGHSAYIEREDREWQGVVTEQPWHDPGFALIRMWKIDANGASRYVAIVMARTPIPGTRGRRLMARFELKKQVE